MDWADSYCVQDLGALHKSSANHGQEYEWLSRAEVSDDDMIAYQHVKKMAGTEYSCDFLNTN